MATSSSKPNTNSLLKTVSHSCLVQGPSCLTGLSAQDFLKSFTDLVSASVKYLIPATKDYHVTRVVDAVMELKSSPDIDNYLYLDPKFQPDSAPRKTTPFRQAIVFVLGGGNYLEYLNLMDYAKRVCVSDVAARHLTDHRCTVQATKEPRLGQEDHLRHHRAVDGQRVPAAAATTRRQNSWLVIGDGAAT